MRIYWKFVLAVLAIQLVLVVTDAYAIVDCHRNGGECWPWLLTFVFNLPLSILIDDLRAILSIHLGFYPQVVAAFLLFVVTGTLWWSLLGHIVVWALSWLIDMVRWAFNKR